jgi:hypothetical protein
VVSRSGIGNRPPGNRETACLVGVLERRVDWQSLLGLPVLGGTLSARTPNNYENSKPAAVAVDRYIMQVAVPAEPEKAGSLALPIVFILWLSIACVGMAALWLYSITAGKEGATPGRWPASSSLQRTPGASTLVMFVHPRCPCSHASTSELAVLLAPVFGCPLFSESISRMP